MHAADVEFPQSLLHSDSPSPSYFMYAVYVQIPSIKVDYSSVTHHAKNFELKGSTLWLMFVAFFKEMFLQEWPKKPNPCRSQFCNYMKLPLLKQHIPKAYSVSPCKPLVCSSFSTSSALVQKIISGVSLYLEGIPLYRKTSAIRCYKRVTHGSLTCIKRYFYIPSQAWKKKWEDMRETAPTYIALHYIGGKQHLKWYSVGLARVFCSKHLNCKSAQIPHEDLVPLHCQSSPELCRALCRHKTEVGS